MFLVGLIGVGTSPRTKSPRLRTLPKTDTVTADWKSPIHAHISQTPPVPCAQAWVDIPPHGAGASALQGHRSPGAGAHTSAECLLLGHREGGQGLGRGGPAGRDTDMLSTAPGPYLDRSAGKTAPWAFLIELLILSRSVSHLTNSIEGFPNLSPLHWALGRMLWRTQG